MLVLSRRMKERIVFPGFSTAVQVLDVKGGKVSLGIEAPREVTVLREELSLHEQPANGVELMAMKQNGQTAEQARQLNHLLRNRLNVASVGLALLARQLEAGFTDEGQLTLEKLREDFQMLADRVETEIKTQTPPPTRKLKSPRALIVEDDQNERELLAGFLRMSGLEVDIAGDGVSALDYLRDRGQPDLILLDMILPRCDGPTTVREIRKDPANSRLKIFGLTGQAPASFHLEGVNRWFRKPINPENLLRDLSVELGS